MSESGKITIDGVTVEPIRLRANNGGLRYAEFYDETDDVCFIGESSRVGCPVVLIGDMGAPMVLTRAHVASLLPHLQRFVERGDLGGEDAADPVPPALALPRTRVYRGSEPFDAILLDTPIATAYFGIEAGSWVVFKPGTNLIVDSQREAGFRERYTVESAPTLTRKV